MPTLSIRARILLAVLERLSDDGDDTILYETKQFASGSWCALAIWRVPLRMGSLSVLGRETADGSTKDEAERKLLGRIWALPLPRERELASFTV